MIEKIDECKTYPENSSTTKVGEHTSPDFSMCTISSFESIENTHDLYIGKDCRKTLCTSLREHAMKMNNFKKKKNWVIIKWTAEPISKIKNMLYLSKKIWR